MTLLVCLISFYALCLSQGSDQFQVPISPIGPLPLPVINVPTGNVPVSNVPVSMNYQVDNCDASVDCSKVKFYFYNTNYKYNGYEIKVADGTCYLPDDFDPCLDAYFPVHGFNASHLKPACQAIKGALLEKKNCNVICMDYAFYSSDYPALVCKTLGLARCLAKAVECIKSKGVRKENIIAVGHSAGAYIAAGCKGLFDFIHGLDPGGPGYGKDSSRRLKSDAARNGVAVYHSNRPMPIGFGTPLNDGTCNIYLNDGNVQPCCRQKFGGGIIPPAFNLNVLQCSHLFSIYLWAELVCNSKMYPVVRCPQGQLGEASAINGTCKGPKSYIDVCDPNCPGYCSKYDEMTIFSMNTKNFTCSTLP